MCSSFLMRLSSIAAYMRLNQNKIKRKLPTELGTIAFLRALWICDNGIEGRIPSELGLMTDMGKMLKASFEGIDSHLDVANSLLHSSYQRTWNFMRIPLREAFQRKYTI